MLKSCECGCERRVKHSENRFIHGHNAPHRGKHLSEKTKEKLRIKNTGKKHSKETIEKIIKGNTGKKMSAAAIEKIRIAKRNESEKTKLKKSIAATGKHLSAERKLALSILYTGRKLSAETINKCKQSWTIEKREKQRIKALNQKPVFFDTNIERIVQTQLNNVGISFEKQKIIANISRVDFFIPSANLIILTDGCYWHGCLIHFGNYKLINGTPIEKVRDINETKTKQLRQKGYKVIRIWEHDITKKGFNVLHFIETPPKIDGMGFCSTCNEMQKNIDAITEGMINQTEEKK